MLHSTATSAEIITTITTTLKAKHPTLAFVTDPSDCWTYGYDNSRMQACPQLVVFATKSSEIETLVQLCHQCHCPLTTRGAATGTTGGCVPIFGGVVLSLERFNRILEVDPGNRVMRVEAGVTNAAVQAKAREHGFFWAPDPGSASVCTVGGNLGFNAAGPRAVKYGSTRENTLGLTAITGIGQWIHAGFYTTKGVGGYDLTRLLIGSEGTLAIITEATLKLTPLPEATALLQLWYSDIQAAGVVISAIMAQPIIPSALEFLDFGALELLRTHSTIHIPAGAAALLLVEIDEARVALSHSLQAIEKAAQSPALLHIATATDPQQVLQFWQARKNLSPILRHIAPQKINEDVVVPVAQLAEFISALQELSKQYQIPIVNFGHAGNGNIHVNLLFDPTSTIQTNNATPCLCSIFTKVLALRGTLSGEHGIGLAKRDFINQAIDETTLTLMRAIKKVFDPHDILNPGKIFSNNTPLNTQNHY